MRAKHWLCGVVIATVAILGGGVISSCTELETGTVYSPPGTTTTIIIVRHAERNVGFDPPLNEEGQARAIALADELEDEGVTAIFHPNLIRNGETASVLLERFDATERVFTTLAAGNTRKLANDFVNEVLADHAGGVVLWIGNDGPVVGNQSGNLQEIYARLGGTGRPPTRYQDMYTIVLTEDMPPAITEGEYGGPSSLD